MAEFTEVMCQAKRLCAAHVHDEFGDINCKNCALWCTIGNVSFCRFSGPSFVATSKYNDVETEAIVMKWAAEHPEPVYPTWEEWQKKTFPTFARDIMPCEFMSYNRLKCSEQVACNSCFAKHIPADIAEKLGIKPIDKERSK